MDRFGVALVYFCAALILPALPEVQATAVAAAYGQAIPYLVNLGYLPKSDGDSQVDYNAALPTALERYQRMARLPVTRALDQGTINKMQEPRCGVKDPAEAPSRTKRFAHAGSKWETNLLKWRIAEYSNQLSHLQVIEVMKKAFDEWSKVTNLYFEYSPTGSADIVVRFTNGAHNDGYSFDGRGGVLAHAFFPPDNERDEVDENAGDLHFDDAETWTVTIHTNGQNLLHVAVHEIGHSLGLQHSNADGSIMWPWNKGAAASAGHLNLAYDDIVSIQTLYGGKRRRYQRDEHTHPLCQHHVDAIFQAVNRKIYLINGNTVLELNPLTFETVGQARSVSSVFPGIPTRSTIDAAVSPHSPIWRNRKSYLFVGSQCYRYSLRRGALVLDDGYPYSIQSRWNISTVNFDTVFTLGNKVKLIFAKGNEYWLHTGTSVGIYSGYPKPMSSNVMLHRFTELSAAFLHPNGTNYFFTDEQVYSSHRSSPTLIQSLC
ncbi:matrix metalloproteinase-24-like [Watersipora subatra]|uniref:matrix metalloproteinase-24-like n=1 Tax=Watersipora subatra TaxID=2589382 RepID=UPI00355C8D09